MKIIFLDIDGVLNSEAFFLEHLEEMEEYPVNRRCVACLQEIVRATGARIVLTSSWRPGWSRDPRKQSDLCRRLSEILGEYGLEISSRTVCLAGGTRAKEVLLWLLCAPGRVERLLILDDNDFGWEACGLAQFWVRTDDSRGGLGAEDVPKAVRILTQGGRAPSRVRIAARLAARR